MVNDLSEKDETIQNELDTNSQNESMNVSDFEKNKTVDNVINESKEGKENVKDSVIYQQLENANIKSEAGAHREEVLAQQQLKINEWNGYKKSLDELIKGIEHALEDCKHKEGVSKSGRKTIKSAKDKLNSYLKTVKAKRDALNASTNKEIYGDDLKMLEKMRQNFNDAKEDIAKGQRGELSTDAPYLYNSTENAKRSNRQQENINKYEALLEKEVKDGAILNIFEGKHHIATNFYRRIAEGEYTSADYTKYLQYSDILYPSFQRCGIPAPVERGITSPSTGVRTGKYIDYSNVGRDEAFKQGGIGGCIDKALSCCNNLTPGQRETWKSLGVLAGFGAGIYGLYKFFTSKKSLLAKAGITAAAFLGSEILTGENPISLFSKFMTGGLSKEKLTGSFGNAISGVRGSEIESSERIAPAMYSLMVFNQGTTIGEINEMTQSFKTDNTTWASFYNQAINQLTEHGGTSCAEYFKATFSEKFDEEKRNNWLASFGVVDISNPSNSAKLIYELANNATMNEVILEKFKSENGLKETNDKTKKGEFKDYLKSIKSNNLVLSVAVLQQHKNDWFDVDNEATYSERSEDKQNKIELLNKVNDLSIDETKKEELKTAIEQFYDKRTIESKPLLSDFSMEIQNGLLIITSHGGEQSKIDLERRELVGFGNEIRFTDLADLINIADITNKILHSQRGKIPVGYPPFKYKIERKAICFNDAKTISTDFDTRVLSTWRWSKIKKTSQVYNHLEEYAQYLSNHRLENNKVEINQSLYPIVKKLSDTGIVFTNENEVKELETRLEKVKDQLSDYYATPTGSPFKISWQLRTIDKKLVFVAIDGEKMVLNEDISGKFPTILANKEKFLNFMNDTKNGMYNPGV